MCRHPLRLGGLCPHRDPVCCPIHGPIIPRDDEGHPLAEQTTLPQPDTARPNTGYNTGVDGASSKEGGWVSGPRPAPSSAPVFVSSSSPFPPHAPSPTTLPVSAPAPSSSSLPPVLPYEDPETASREESEARLRVAHALGLPGSDPPASTTPVSLLLPTQPVKRRLVDESTARGGSSRRGRPRVDAGSTAEQLAVAALKEGVAAAASAPDEALPASVIVQTDGNSVASVERARATHRAELRRLVRPAGSQRLTREGMEAAQRLRHELRREPLGLDWIGGFASNTRGHAHSHSASPNSAPESSTNASPGSLTDGSSSPPSIRHDSKRTLSNPKLVRLTRPPETARDRLERTINRFRKSVLAEARRRHGDSLTPGQREEEYVRDMIARDKFANSWGDI